VFPELGLGLEAGQAGGWVDGGANALVAGEDAVSAHFGWGGGGWVDCRMVNCCWYMYMCVVVGVSISVLLELL
jgi:hypothetical protein